MCKKQYNGYANYETWNVGLWLDNDQGHMERIQELTDSVWNESHSDKYASRFKNARRSLADALKEYVEELNDDVLSGSSMATDLLRAALDSVEWTELAENYLESAGYTPEMTNDDSELSGFDYVMNSIKLDDQD